VLQFAIQAAVQRNCIQWGDGPVQSMVSE
jgi:hypothetical protein